MSAPTVTIASIVEGEGEVRALPKLLFRLAKQFSATSLRVPTPVRVPRGKLVAAGGIERAVSAQAWRVGASGGVLVLLDADDDCPAKLGPALLSRAHAARPDVLVSVVIANREFEAWFLAAAASLAGHHGFPTDLSAPADPERIRGGKEWTPAPLVVTRTAGTTVPPKQAPTPHLKSNAHRPAPRPRRPEPASAPAGAADRHERGN